MAAGGGRAVSYRSGYAGSLRRFSGLVRRVAVVLVFAVLAPVALVPQPVYANDVSPEYSEEFRARVAAGERFAVSLQPLDSFDGQMAALVAERGGECRFVRSSNAVECQIPALSASGATVNACMSEVSPVVRDALTTRNAAADRTLLETVREAEYSGASAFRSGVGGAVAARAVGAVAAGAGKSAAGGVLGAAAAGAARGVFGGPKGILIGGLVGAAVYVYRASVGSEKKKLEEAEDVLSSRSVTTTTADGQRVRVNPVEEVRNFEVCMMFAAFDISREALPAWRWRDGGDLYSRRERLTEALPAGIASLSFTGASTIWSWVVDLVRQGTDLDVVSKRANDINQLFLRIVDGVRDSGLIMLALIVTLVAGITLFTSGRAIVAFKSIITAAIPVAMLVGVTSITMTGPVDETGHPRGSPGWIGLRGVALTQNIAASLTTGFSTDVLLTGSNTLATVMGEDDTACAAYVRELYSIVEDTSVNRILIRRDSDRELASAGPTQVISVLWQAGFLAPWQFAQYGSVSEGRHIYCFDQERRAGVLPAEQQLILQEATGALYHVSAFSLFGESDLAQEARLYAWAACAPDGEGSFNPSSEWQRIADVTEDLCSAWFIDGDSQLIENLSFRSRSELRGAAMTTARASGDGGAGFRTIVAHLGELPGARAAQSIVTILVSAFYFYSLGGLAIGSILAQYGLFMLLALLPLTLTLIAFPGADGGRNQGGIRLLKMTGTMFFAKLILEVVIALLLQLISLLTGLAESVSLSSGISSALVPLVALFILKKVLQAVGLGNIQSFFGAVAMTTAMAAAATRDSSISSGVSNATPQQGRELRRLVGGASKLSNRASSWTHRRVARKYYKRSKKERKKKPQQEKRELRGKVKQERREAAAALAGAASAAENLGDKAKLAQKRLGARFKDDPNRTKALRESSDVAGEIEAERMRLSGSSEADVKAALKARRSAFEDGMKEFDSKLADSAKQRDLIDQYISQLSQQPPSPNRDAMLDTYRRELDRLDKEMESVLESRFEAAERDLQGAVDDFRDQFGSASSEFAQKYGRRRRGPELPPNFPPELTP